MLGDIVEMSFHTQRHHLRTISKQLARDRSGFVAVMFALLLLPLVAAIGAAVDYGFLSAYRTRLQASVDSAALSVASSLTTQNTAAKRQTVAENTVKAALGKLWTDLGVRVTESEPSAGVYRIQATATVPMQIMKIVGIPSRQVSATAQALPPSAGGALEVAMALDVSGSMLAGDIAPTRIAALKTAAANLVDTLVATIPVGQLKFGYVPFTMNVNIGTANSAYVVDSSHALFGGAQWAGCVSERPLPHHISNAYDGSDTSAQGKWRAYIHPPEPNGSSGCSNPSNGTNSGYASVDPYTPGNLNAYTKGPNYNCVRQPIAPLTANIASIKTGIQGLSAAYNNGTMVAPGLSWALRLLTPNAPFPGAAPFSATTKKVIVALTDGQQTTEVVYGGGNNSSCKAAQNTNTAYKFDPKAAKLSGRALNARGPNDNFSAYGYIYDSDPFGANYASIYDVDASLDPLLLSACAFAKSQQNVEIYTIAVSSQAGPGTAVYNSLKACASDAQHFYYATDSSGLNQAFSQIAVSAAKGVVRLNK